MTATVHRLVSMFDMFTDHESGARRVLEQITASGTDLLDDRQQEVFHQLADHYGTRALDYVINHGGDRDGSRTAPGMVIIQNAKTADRLMARCGMPAGHIPDHGMWSVTRAMLAAFTWSLTENGVVETEARLTRAERVPITP